MRSALDTAFLRRLRFIVEFSAQPPDERREIWRRVFPPSTPTEGLDYARLARLNFKGGDINNVAMNAAFLAPARAPRSPCPGPRRRPHRGREAEAAH